MELQIGNNNYKISMPLNSWDMNFHVIDQFGNDHLVDLQDVIDWKYEITQDQSITGANINDVKDMIDEIGLELASWKSI